MCAPNNDPNQAGRARFERSQIADAAFIGATAIIDHEHVAGLRSLHRFQKHIDASIMPCRKRPAGQTRGGNQRRNSRRREAQWNFQAQRRVRHERRGKFREPLPQPFIFHPTILREIALRCQGSFRIVVGARLVVELTGSVPAANLRACRSASATFSSAPIAGPTMTRRDRVRTKVPKKCAKP